jgi:hypothetical protein
MYKKWCENVSTLDEAIGQVQRDLRLAISIKENSKIYNYTKLLSYLVVCWCESRIMKLIHEPAIVITAKNGIINKPKSFSLTEIDQIISSSTLKDKWLTALQIAIAKAYNVPLDANFPRTLSFTPRSRYLEIEELISNELLPSIELRNRIAHGQWKQAFTNDLKAFSQPHTTSLRTENIVELQLNFAMFKAIGQLVHDLASSRATFERDFDNNYRVVEQNKLNLHNRDYNIYCQKLVVKYTRGVQRRNQNSEPSSVRNDA